MALEAEVMSTFASQVLRPMILSYGLHDQCPTIGREFVERCLCLKRGVMRS